jgi:carbamoyl-phosphate synthase large subunit
MVYYVQSGAIKMKNKKVFVTGGAGVIGQELVPKLIAAGSLVWVGDLKPRPSLFPKEVMYRRGDLNTLTIDELEEFAPDVIIHLAATFERSTETYAFWGENFLHNVHLSHHLMTLARSLTNLKKVVFASSYLIYDPNLYQFDTPPAKPKLLSEYDPIMPRNLTGMAKLSHEMELQFLSGFKECPFTTLCVRIFRGYGCGSRDVISRWVRSALIQEEILVYREDGYFDFIFAADSAEGLLRLAGTDSAKGIVNLGTGQSNKVKNVLDILLQYFPDLKIRYVDSDIPFEASQANTNLLNQLTGWVPETDLAKGIGAIIDYERSKSDGPEPKIQDASPNVLVTSASRKWPLLMAVKKAITKIYPDAKLIAGDTDPLVPTRFLADDFWLMPRLEKLSIDQVIEKCGSLNIKVIVPTRDQELAWWAKNQANFRKAGIMVIVSNESTINLCLDKLEFAKFCRDRDILAIETSTSPEDISSDILVVKERYGAGSQNIGLALTKEAASIHAKKLNSPIFQPFVEGLEISIDSWSNLDGEVIGLVMRTRDRVVSGESQISTTFRNDRIEATARTALNALRLNGPAVLQAFITEDKMNIIECNPRFGGASTTSIAVGLDSFYWSISEAVDPLFKASFKRSQREVRQVRFPVDKIIYDPDI